MQHQIEFSAETTSMAISAHVIFERASGIIYDVYLRLFHEYYG